MSRNGSFAHWWTEVETSRDKRTGALATIKHGIGGWQWAVIAPDGPHARGSSTSQKGARAACRRVVKKIP